MADVFLSYKREDRARAATVVAALRATGRSVWWDEGLTPRQAWDATIEHEIAAAASVVVLWSPRSVASDWVRTEAHYAQDHAKLVPVLIEPCTIPLAFMLKQAVDLSRWGGAADDPAWRKLLEWLEAAGSASGPAPHPPARKAPRKPTHLWGGGLALAAIALSVAALVLLHPHAAAHGASIRVARFDIPPGDAPAAVFSQGFAADLAQVVTAGGSKLKVLDGESPQAGGADYTLNGAVRSAGSDLQATLTLNSAADGAIIWSTRLARPLAQANAMHHEAEVRMGAVFVCALDEAARNREIVSLDALKVYLQACEELPSGDDLHTRKLLRDLVALAPRFAQGWALLAEWNGFIAGNGDENALPAVKEALDDAAHALALDPRNASAWVARAMVKTKISEWRAAQADLDKALALDPDEPIGNYFYATNLINVGRIGEALDYSQRAASSGPMFWPKTELVIRTVADLGRLDEAQALLAAARRTWPEQPDVPRLMADFAARYGDPAKARAVLDALGDGARIDTSTSGADAMAIVSAGRLELLRAEASARLDPSPTNIAAATRAIAKTFPGPDGASGAAFNFMVIGRTDEAYAALGKSTTLLSGISGDDASLFFRLPAAKFRADPRFMPLAASLGLIAIWRATRWPDFCTEHDAPYDCRAVAAKLPAAGAGAP